ncbi:ATP-dependent DNA ligase [Candidatus Micrarchaeota archaeon]|nr:ATP-dependent DNA ligase [Candidatus Micrarchaeota archaeon]
MLLFSDVAKVFDEIEKLSGRLEMTDILAELFKKTDAKEIDKLVYIMQGIVAPPYSGIDLGIGERFAVDAVASASGYSVSQVDAEYRKSGDLGDTTEKLLEKRKQTALFTSNMNVKYVYDAVMKISKSSGQGSQEQKIKYLTELLNNATPLEGRYIIRFVLGSLRLGVGDPTILDAISVAHKGDKSLREELERAYNVCADMGLVARLFYEDPKNIEKFKVQPFKPLMPALAERLSTPEQIIEKIGKCGVEMKYDGLRLQCHKKDGKVEIYSRKLEKMTRMFPDVVEAIMKLKPNEIIFEGEALAYDKKNKRYFSFQQTMHRRRKHGINEASKEFPMNVFVFDLLYIDGKDLTNVPYKERRAVIKKLFKGKGILKPSESKLISKSEKLEEMFLKSTEKGLEGIMAKDLNAPYTAGKRKFAWIKLKKSYGKSVDTIDGVIVGYYRGHGSRTEFEFGGLLLAVQNSDTGRLETIAKIGSGFTEDEMMKLRETLDKIKTKNPPTILDYKLEADFWVEPKYVIEVAFDDITISSIHTCAAKDGKGYALRFPRMVALRDDKGIRDITTSEEVDEMHNLQHPR